MTYLFAGTIVHRDSLGSVQAIESGAVNWMTAGRGIVHSERSETNSENGRKELYGIQIRVALPKRHEETDPDFTHYAAARCLKSTGEGKTVRLIAGSLFGKASPVKTFSGLFYADATVDAGASLVLNNDYDERAIYSSRGTVEIPGQTFAPGRLLVFSSGDSITNQSSFGGSVRPFGRRTARQSASTLVEFRLKLARADRASQVGLESGRFAPVPGDRVYSAARVTVGSPKIFADQGITACHPTFHHGRAQPW